MVSILNMLCYRLGKKFMVFVHDGMFINPARIDPAITYTHKPSYSGARTMYLTCYQQTPFICVSVLYCHRSSLTSLTACPTKVGYPQNYHKCIHGIFHTVDSDRIPSMLCMAFRVDTLKAPFKENAMIFSTRVTIGLISFPLFNHSKC